MQGMRLCCSYTATWKVATLRAYKTRSTTPSSLRNFRYLSADAPARVELPEQANRPSITGVDHRDVGTQQVLFFTSPLSPGSPIFTPFGTRIFQKIVLFLQAQNRRHQYAEVITPTIYKKELWERSGHWDVYKDAMFQVKAREDLDGKDEEYGLKPMNCPGHCLLFDSEARSYKQLPIRYSEFGPLHRNELSGALSGLTRVRKFHQDDGHVFCQRDQIKAEIRQMLDSLKTIYQTFGFHSHKLVLSTRPDENYIGRLEDWNMAEAALTEALEANGQPWTLNKGDGAFYGPKIDIILEDSDGKEHQTATIQLDFQLPKRFALKYQAPDSSQRDTVTGKSSPGASSHYDRPVMIHRAMVGSVERFMALLAEHYQGQWPFWLSPRQIQILTINNDSDVMESANQLRSLIERCDRPNTTNEEPIQIASDYISCDINSNAEGLAKKIKKSLHDRWSIRVVVGPKDLAQNTVNADFSSLPERSRQVVTEILSQMAGESGFEAHTATLNQLEMQREDLLQLLRTLLAKFV